MEILSGTHLTLALSRTSKPIELRDMRGERVAVFADREQPGVTTLPFADLFLYVARGYEVRGTKRRARYVMPARPKSQPQVDTRVFVRDASFWDGRGCIRFWGDQRSPVGIQA